MSLPALATPSDLGTWLGQAIDDDDARALAVLDAASGLVRDASGQTWVDSEADPPGLTEIPQTALTITLTAAARAWANPTGASSATTGPFAAAWSGGAGVMLTDEEREALSSLRPGGGVTGLSSVRVVAPGAASASRVLAWGELQQFDGDDDL